jgi:hypothetical protein
MKSTDTPAMPRRTPWNKGNLIGQKPPLELGEVWAVRNGRPMADNTSDIALCNLPVDTKLRGCDLVRLTV